MRWDSFLRRDLMMIPPNNIDCSNKLAKLSTKTGYVMIVGRFTCGFVARFLMLWLMAPMIDNTSILNASAMCGKYCYHEQCLRISV